MTPSFGYDLPPFFLRNPGIFGRILIVSKVFSSRMRASSEYATRIPPEGSTAEKGYRLYGSESLSHCINSHVGPPGGFGRISIVGIGLPSDPSSPPMIRIEPLTSCKPPGYQRPCCKRMSSSKEYHSWSCLDHPLHHQEYKSEHPRYCPLTIHRQRAVDLACRAKQS